MERRTNDARPNNLTAPAQTLERFDAGCSATIVQCINSAVGGEIMSKGGR